MRSYSSYSRWALYLLVSLTVLLSAGCLEVSEEIRITKSGEANLVITLKGDVNEFYSVVAIPSEPDWQIDTVEIKHQTGEDPQITIRAAQVVKPGQGFPGTFADLSDPLANKQLQFPTELKMWSEGSRTFYEFRRTYQSRRYSRFIGGVNDQIDENLEKRVLDRGIFNVSESDRTKYLRALSHQFQLQIIGFYEEGMGELILTGKLKADKLAPLSRRASKILDNTLSQETVLALVSLPDDSIEVALNELKAEIETRFMAAVGQETAGSDDITGKLRAALARINLEWGVTENLDDDLFSIELYMPGILISTNANLQPDYPGATCWEFEGKDLHDRSIGLYALSVVEQ